MGLLCEGSSNNHQSGSFNTSSTGNNTTGGGPNPPQGDSSIAASGSSLNHSDHSDHSDNESNARSSGEYTDRSFGSMVDKDDYVKYSESSNTVHTGCEKNGFMSKAHERVYNAVLARVAAMEAAKNNPNNPDLQPNATGLYPKENAYHSNPNSEDLKISKEDFKSTVKYLNIAKADGTELKGYIVFKPAATAEGEQVNDIQGVKLTIDSKLTGDGAALFVRNGKFANLTNKELESTILAQLNKHTGRI